MKETNHEQLYTYLKQHEKHVAHGRLMNDKFNPTTNDSPTLVLSIQTYTHMLPAQISQSLEFVINAQIDSGFTQTYLKIENLTIQIIFLAQYLRTSLPKKQPTENILQYSKSSNGRGWKSCGSERLRKTKSKPEKLHQRQWCYW